MNESIENVKAPEPLGSSRAWPSAAAHDGVAEPFPKVRIPAPPVPGKVAWSLNPDLPE